MCSHVPNKGEQMVRYGACPAVTCGSYYSNVARGNRKTNDQDELIPYILEPDKSSKERRKNWSRLIQKIYEADPLICPKCSGEMKVISVIEDEEVIKKILRHLGLRDLKARSPTKSTCLRADTHRQAGPPKPLEYTFDYSTSQLPASDNLSRASRSNEWLYVYPEYLSEA